MSRLLLVPAAAGTLLLGADLVARNLDDSAIRRIASIDIAGDAAVAKLEQKRPDLTVTDYMSLIRVGDRWLIGNKIFSRTSKRGAGGGT